MVPGVLVEVTYVSFWFSEEIFYSLLQMRVIVNVLLKCFGNYQPNKKIFCNYSGHPSYQRGFIGRPE